jgi:hypothetical protein
MPASWRIAYWPTCIRHVFLSHCAENRADLIDAVVRQLRQQGITAFYDTHHYPFGVGPYAALREEILRCRHVVFFITQEVLSQSRGWIHLEKAYAELVQQNLRYAGPHLSGSPN